MRIPTALIVLAGFSATAAFGQDRAPTVAESVSDGMEVVDPLAFQATAAAWNTFLIRSSQLALEKSNNSELRLLASMLIDEHAILMPALSTAAQADKLPTAPVEGLDGRQSGMMGKLEAARDNDFDRLFLDMQATAHQEAVGLFSGFSKSGQGQLQTFAQKTLPQLRRHLAQIESVLNEEAVANPS